jgi:glycine/D-amino acid oxidase-like deaminating enzyme/nitrite reductase/ring-hydroxylating ferredoxin subunit
MQSENTSSYNGFTDNGHTRSSWMSVETPQGAESLPATEVDVCIVGAGIAGLTTAYLLLKVGKSVLVLDDGRVAGGESSRTSAHLASEIDDGYTEIERIHSTDGAMLAYESHSTAIDTIERIAREENIECDFRRVDGYLWAPQEGSTQDLEEELAAAQRAGFGSAGWVERAPLDGFDSGRCLRFPNQAQFHPLKYLAGLARCIERDGGQIVRVHADEIHGGTPATVKTADGQTIHAGAVVVATNSPVNDRVKIHTKQAAYRTYMLGFKIPAGAVPQGVYWDTLDPYHYVRVQQDEDGEILLVGGEDHKTGQENDMDARWAALESWTREHFPQSGEIAFRWSGQVVETVDGLAYIGYNHGAGDMVFVATGDSGMGLTHGTIAGNLLTDLICGRANSWAQIYDPSRKPIGAARDWLDENLNVVAQYSDLVTGGDVHSEEDIPAGQGAVVRHGVHKVAVFRDEAGALHRCSAVCPHLGAIVSWNDGEKTWDCPAHGSRFAADGHVVNGPANHELGKIDG